MEKLKVRKILLQALIISFCFMLILSLVTYNEHSEKATLNGIEVLSFQKSHTIEVFPGVTKKIEINREELAKYINKNNEVKIMKAFALQYESILRTSEIYFATFSNKTQNNEDNATIFDLNKDLQTQESTVFHLDFLAKFEFHEIHKIELDIRSKSFSVISLTLMNNEISNEIDLHKIENAEKFGRIPIWMPYSYDPETEKSTQMTKYLYFKAAESSTKLRINRIKGHPKIFLYNCEANKINFCREEIDDEHIQGTLILQKELEITLEKETKCKNCLIIIGIKNMGAETKIEITEHKIHDTLVLFKDNPTYHSLKSKESLEVTSYFNLPDKIHSNPYFLDIFITEGNSNSLTVKFVSIEAINKESFNKEIQIAELSQFFTTESQSKAIRIKLNPSLDFSIYLKEKDSNNETWYKINLIIEAKNILDLIIVDRNIPEDIDNFIALKDGQIFHSYVFPSIDSTASPSVFSEKFKVKLSSISLLTVSSSCSEINKMVIQFFSLSNKESNESQIITKISPKIFVENITHHNKKCSQLIHLNPHQLFLEDKNKDHKEEREGWVYFKIEGIKTEVDMLYSSSDIITLEKSFPYHSQLQYNQALYLHIPKLQNKAIIKIQKCSDCQVTLAFSEEQLVDIKAKRSHPIIEKEVTSINNIFAYEMKDHNGLFVKVKTNNYAHFVIIVEELEGESTEIENLGNIPEESRKIFFSLEENNTLTLEFPTPTFFYTNNLNSPTYFTLIEGSINVQVSRETYCPEFIFSEKERTRDISITQIMPQLINDEEGNERLTFSMEVKHHDFFGIRAQKGDEIFSYKVVNIESMKSYSLYRWSIFHVALFLTFALFMSFVCFMALKKNRIKKVGGEIIRESEDGEETSMVRLN